jgi:anti-sigma factor ChrR (cupin superfamily)
MTNTNINADMRRRVSVDTAAMDWAPSPSGTVWRKRVHLVGPAESGQVTSVVRYEPGATFPGHEHPGGEEILVLEGTFSDEHGDWPAGTYLLNPEGFRHAPFSRQGCVLFVKLRQYAGADRLHDCVDTSALPWRPTAQAGVEAKQLYAQSGYPDTVALECWSAGVCLEERSYPEGVEYFVLEGSFDDEEGSHRTGAWLRLPNGSRHRPFAPEGCVVYVKRDGVGSLAAR